MNVPVNLSGSKISTYRRKTVQDGIYWNLEERATCSSVSTAGGKIGTAELELHFNPLSNVQRGTPPSSFFTNREETKLVGGDYGVWDW